MLFTPSPGIVYVEKIEEEDQGVYITQRTDKRVLIGKVIAVGQSIVDKNRDDYAKEGDLLAFLSYEGNYDNFTYQNKEYYVVNFGDCRGIINEK